MGKDFRRGFCQTTIVVFGLLGFAACSKGPTDSECATFKTGTFTYTKQSLVRIERTENYQLEYSIDPENPFRDSNIITWTSPCSYALTYAGSDNPDGLENWNIDEPILVTITEIVENRCRFTAKTSTFEKENQLVKLKH